MTNDIRAFLDLVKNVQEVREIAQALDYLSYCGGAQTENYEPSHEVIPLEEFKALEKLPDFIEALWWRLVQPTELTTRAKTFMKICIDYAIERLSKEDGPNDHLRLILVIFSPKPYTRSEYRYSNEYNEKSIPNKISEQLTRYFGQVNGIELIKQKIKVHKCSFDTLKKLLNIIKKYSKRLQTPESDQEIEQFVKLVISKVLGASDEEFKNENKKDMDLIIKYLNSYISNTTENTSRFTEIIQTFSLDVAFKCFKSPSLEKRNAGLNDIIKYTKFNESYMMYKQGHSISQEKLVNWIKENKIVEILYGETMHIQLLQKCTDILKFLVDKKAFERKYLDLMWNAAEGKHETIENVIYETIGNISQILPLSEVEYLYQKIKEIPLSQYTNQTLQLISCLTQHRTHHYNSINSIDTDISSSPNHSPSSSSVQLQQQQQQQQSSSQPPSPTLQTQSIVSRGLEIFWILIQDDSEVSSELAHQALYYLQETLNFHSNYRNEYLQKCVDNIKNHTTVIFSLRIIQNIIVTHSDRVRSHRIHGGNSGTIAIMGGNNQQVPPIQDIPASCIRSVNEQTDLIHIFFEHLTHYKAECESALSKIMNVDGIDQPISDVILQGKHSHIEQIHEYLNFLYFILDQGHYRITDEQLNILWQVFVVNPISPRDRDTFFKWTEKSLLNDSQTHLTEILNKFEEISFVDLEPSGASLYIACMKDANRHISNPGTELIGVETLWRMALESRNEEVGRETNSFLIELYKYIRTLNHTDEFFIICMKELSEIPFESAKSGDGNSRVMRILSLMQIYIESYGSHVSDSFRKCFAPTINVTFTTQKVRHTLQVRASERIVDIKHRLGNILKAHPGCLTLFHQSKQMIHDWETLIDYNVCNQDTILVNEMNEPRPYTQNDDQFKLDFDQSKFSLLFSLLSIESLAPTVWEVLVLLPVNRNYVQVISSITSNESAAGINWEQLLDHQSVFKLLYTLLIIDHYVSDMPWRTRFIESGGLKELINILMTVDLQDESKGQKRKKCLSLLLTIITMMLFDQNFLIVQSLLNVPPSNFLSRLLDLTWKQAQETIKEEEEEQFNLHHFLTDDGEVIQNLMWLIISLLRIPEQLDEFCKRPNINEWILSLLIKSKDISIRDCVYARLEQFCSNNEQAHNFFLSKCLEIVHKTVGTDKYSFTSSQFFSLFASLLSRSCSPNFIYHQQQQTSSQGGSQSQISQSNIQPEQIIVEQFSGLLTNLVKWIKGHPVVETQNNMIQPDQVLIGLLQLVTILVRASPKFKLEAGFNQDLVGEVFHQCLFDIATADNHGPLCPPKCKTKESRDVCFALLLELAKDCAENYTRLVNELIIQNKPDEKRTLWSYFPAGNEKSACGYVGLKNLGATCYINSLMQQLFMIPAFRYSILQTDEVNPSNESLLQQLKIIFANLQESEKRSHDPKDFCLAYKYDGQPINVYVQMDVDEFFNMLFDRLENQLKGTENEKLLNDFFGGSTVNQFISQECPHVSEREESFYTISVEVKNKKDILESLQLFVESETLDGDNKYFCSQCSQKVKCLMRRCVKKLPNTLIIHNKRFEFDLDLMRRTKINDALRFPMTLDMSPYTKEYLERKEALEKEKQQAMSEEGGGEQQKPQPTNPSASSSPSTLPQLHPPSYYQYELSGILVHSGTADSGHYYSFIKEREPHPSSGQQRRWIQFNDQLTEIFNPEDIAKACFGGYDQSNDKGIMGRPTPRFNNAYMLFYERVGCGEGAKLNYQNLNPSQQSKLVPQDIFNQVWKKNMKFLNDKNIFDQSYFSFIGDVLHIDPIVPNNTKRVDHFDQTMMAIELGTRFIVETISHARERKSLPEFVNFIIQMYERSPNSCAWLLRTIIDNSTWIKQNLLVCVNPEPREMFAKILYHVLRMLIPHEKHLYLEYEPSQSTSSTFAAHPQQQQQHQQVVGAHRQKFLNANGSDEKPMDLDKKPSVRSVVAKDEICVQVVDSKEDDEDDDEEEEEKMVPKSLVAHFMDTYLEFIKVAPNYWKHFAQYFLFIRDFAYMGREERGLLLNRGVLTSLIDFFMGEDSPIREPNQKKTRMGDKLGQPQHAGMLETVAILCRSAHTKYSLQTGRPIPESFEQHLLPMSGDDYEMLSNPAFIAKTLRDQIHQKSSNEIIAHLCYGDLDYSMQLINAIEPIEGKQSLDALLVLIQLEDDYQYERCNRAIRAYINILEDSGSMNKKYSPPQYARILIELASNNQIIADWFKMNLDEWAFTWLVYEISDVRSDAFYLLIRLYGFSEKLEYNTTGDNDFIYPQMSDEQINQIRLLYQILVSNLSEVKDAVTNDKDSRIYNRYENYIKLMTMCLLQDPTLKETFKDISKNVLKILLVFISINQAIEKNRQEMMHFVATMIQDHPENLKILLANSISSKFMDYFISISPKEDLKSYNSKSLPYFYRVLYTLVRASPEIAQNVCGHNNYCWAMNYIYLECGDYAEAAKWLYLMTEYFSQKYPQMMSKILTNCLNFHNSCHYPPHLAPLMLLLTTKKRDASLFFLTYRIQDNSWVPIESIVKALKNKASSYHDHDPNINIKMLELINKVLVLVRKDAPPTPPIAGSSTKDPITIDGVVAGEDSTNQQQQKKVEDSIQVSVWEPTSPQLKVIVTTLFQFFEAHPSYAANVVKIFNLIACDCPIGLITILSDYVNKKNTPTVNISQIQHHNQHHPSNGQEMIDSDKVINQHLQHLEEFYLDMMNIIKLAIQNTNQPQIQHKGFTIILKLIKEMISIGLDRGYTAMVELAAENPIYLKDEEKASIVLFAVSYPHTLSHHQEFFAMVKGFFVDIERYLSNQSNQVLTGIIRTVEDQVNTLIASINSLTTSSIQSTPLAASAAASADFNQFTNNNNNSGSANMVNEEIDKNMSNLTDSLKSIEIMSSNADATSQISQLFDILQSFSSQISDDTDASKLFKSTLTELLKNPK